MDYEIKERRTIIYKFSETFFSHDVAVPVPGGHGGGPDGAGPAAASPRPAAEPRAALPRPRPRQPRLSQVIFLNQHRANIFTDKHNYF